jgi:apolipoprotein N-acyltransferase
MVNISEDGWFGSSIGPKQHFAHSILEQLKVVSIYYVQQIMVLQLLLIPWVLFEHKVQYGQSGYIDFKKAQKTQPTLFSKYGNKIFITLILIYIFLIFSFNRFTNE